MITQLHKDLPLIYLYRLKNFTGVARTVVGVQVYGDGLIRFAHAGFAAWSPVPRSACGGQASTGA